MALSFLVRKQVITGQRTLADSFDIYNANSYWYRPSIYVLVDQEKV